jgi:hypothetical protein
MSQRGRDSGPPANDVDGEDAAPERLSGGSPSPPVSPRPIEPYDPYRGRSGDAPRAPTRNVAAESFDARGRPVTRASSESPFLPDDDLLNAEAWQLESEEIIVAGEDEPLPAFDRDTPPAPRRHRRQPSKPRERREPAPRATPPRRSRASPAAARGQTARPTLTIGMPQAVAGASLVADQAALALLGLNVISILLMAILLAVRIGGLPSSLILQLDAAGNPALWGPPSALWRLPLMSFFLTLMFGVVAWFLHPLDRFAARFALGSAIVAQLIAWVALIQHLRG